jgi:hypothetical protein
VKYVKYESAKAPKAIWNDIFLSFNFYAPHTHIYKHTHARL